ncbi:hypothetical protein GQ53DRAFT_835153 [Thozetella sp. PMI_491]|nr:hypothetical protein GQ53DRAFT_835153 [Thozetella sp. PMI_491]
MKRRAAQREGSTPSRSPLPEKIKPTACRKCHARKIKCSGGKPCTACTQSSCETDCTYPRRDRQLKVSQSYIEALLEENERLRQAGGEKGPAAAPAEPSTTTGRGGAAQEQNEGAARNPLFDDRPWFLHMTASDTPILIGEAADAAFATRVRQALSGGQSGHIPRVNYPSDGTLSSLKTSHCPLPSPGRARFLVRAAMRTVSECFHIVLRSAVFEGLDRFLQNPTATESSLACKFWALLALGEVYSVRAASSEFAFPGLSYFTQASRLVPMVQERPILDSIESILLLCLYSLASNRRHSAFSLAGVALRYGVVMGLHLNIPEAQLSDRATREHRNRLWWSAYMFDRMLSSRLGQPASIQDDDIHVDFPSNDGLQDCKKGDFGDAEYLIAQIKLAKLGEKITASLYGRKAQKEPFSQRVQQVLKDLQNWVQNLPNHLQMDNHHSSQPTTDPIRYLHLSFNQSVVLATRPVLLSVLRAHRDAWQSSTSTQDAPQIPENVQALADACIRCSKHSHRLLTEAWLDGSFSTFDYFNSQYLFTVATVLSISGLLQGPRSAKDEEDFQLATQLLAELKQNGSFAANEFHQHLVATEACIRALPARTENPGSTTSFTPVASSSDTITAQVAEVAYPMPFMTAEMALAEPSLQAFLAQNDPNLQHMDISILENGLDGFYWPESGSAMY